MTHEMINKYSNYERDIAFFSKLFSKKTINSPLSPYFLPLFSSLKVFMSDTTSPLLARSIFSSEGLAHDDSFAIWSESISPLFNPSIKDEQEPFSAHVEAVTLDNLMMASTQTTRQQFHRHQQLARKDQVDHLLLQLYLTGGYCGHNGKNKMAVKANDISLLDLGHEVHTQGETSHSLSVIIPRDLWFSHSEKKSIPHGLTLQSKSAMGHVLGEHIKSVWAATKKAQQHEVSTLGKTLLSVAQHCLTAEFEYHGKKEDKENKDVMRQATLNSIQLYIQNNLTSPTLSPESICHAFKCSRSYLYRLFEPLGGVACHIQRQRLEKCYQALISWKNKHRRIAEIAFYWGFNSQSHFSRLFRKAYGISPKQARALRQDLTQQEVVQVSNTITEQNTPDYQQWLLTL